MAFPVIQTYSHGIVDQNTSHSVMLPNDISSGDLILVFITFDINSSEEVPLDISIDTSSSGSNWVEISKYIGTDNAIACYKKIAETSNILVLNTSEIESSSYISYRITGGSIVSPIIETNSGGSTNADPPALTPINGANDYLWIVYAGIDGSVVATSAPTDFSNLIIEQADLSVDGVSSSAASRQYNTSSSYNPGSFTSASSGWATFTVCISPAGVDGIGFGNISYYSI